ncbi:MAG TPA: hypothetical protein PKC20_08325 [Burkholderiaceae bacterium]|nr:hypothetical protein [Burkholderiaceae bacterium]
MAASKPWNAPALPPMNTLAAVPARRVDTKLVYAAPIDGITP